MAADRGDEEVLAVREDRGQRRQEVTEDRVALDDPVGVDDIGRGAQVSYGDVALGRRACFGNCRALGCAFDHRHVMVLL
ncbi:MAG: hypothetical protein V9E94_20020 [Microthrixaceae bacterium]